APIATAGFCCFFQAEDGIRDFHVTGVQTCALPILTVTGTGSAGRSNTLGDRTMSASIQPTTTSDAATHAADTHTVTVRTRLPLPRGAVAHDSRPSARMS